MLINYIPDPIRKNIRGFKDLIASLFKTTTPKQAVYGRRNKLIKPKTQSKKKKTVNTDRIEGIIRNIWTLFETEGEKERNKREKKKKLIID